MDFYRRVIVTSFLMGFASFLIWSNNQTQLAEELKATSKLSTIEFKGIKIHFLGEDKDSIEDEYLNYILSDQNELLKNI